METTHDIHTPENPLEPAERALLLAMIRSARELDTSLFDRPEITPEHRERWAAQVDSLSVYAEIVTTPRTSLDLLFPIDDEQDCGADWRFFSAMTKNLDAEVTLSIFRDETVAGLTVESAFEAEPRTEPPAPDELDFRYRCVEDLCEKQAPAQLR